MNAENKSKIIAYVDSGILALGLLLVGIFGLIFTFEYNPSEEEKGKVARILYVGLLIRSTVAALIQLALIVLLLEGVLLRNYKRCTVWILISKVFIALLTISAIIKLFMDPIFSESGYVQ